MTLLSQFKLSYYIPLLRFRAYTIHFDRCPYLDSSIIKMLSMFLDIVGFNKVYPRQPISKGPGISSLYTVLPVL